MASPGSDPRRSHSRPALRHQGYVYVDSFGLFYRQRYWNIY